MNHNSSAFKVPIAYRHVSLSGRGRTAGKVTIEFRFPLPIGMYPSRDMTDDQPTSIMIHVPIAYRHVSLSGLNAPEDRCSMEACQFPLPIGMYPSRDENSKLALSGGKPFPLPIGMYPSRDANQGSFLQDCCQVPIAYRHVSLSGPKG